MAQINHAAPISIQDGRIDKLCELALANVRNYHHIAFVTTAKGSILAVGTNDFRTHTLNKTNNYRSDYIHAEIAAIVKVDRSIFYNDTPINMYSLRFGKDGRLLMAKPCDLCEAILERYTNIKNIFYSNEKGQIVKL